MRRTGFRLGTLPDSASSGHVTLSLPVKKAPLGRILRNFRLHMRRTYFRTEHMTDVTKVSTRADIAQLPVAHAQNILPNRVHDWRHFRSRDWRYFRDWCYFRSKAPTRAKIAQLPVVHAQNIFPDIARGWRHFRSCAMVRSTARSTANATLSVPLYYLYYIHKFFISTTYTQYRVKGYKQTKNGSNTYTNNNYHTQTNKKVVSQYNKCNQVPPVLWFFSQLFSRFQLLAKKCRTWSGLKGDVDGISYFSLISSYYIF
jgi:hypothetical protein